MSIAERIQKALDDLAIGEYENSLIQICSAIDASGKRREPGSRSSKRFRAFIREYEHFIYHIAMDGRVKCNNILFSDGARLEDILYKSVRCTLIHEADISNVAVFRRELEMGYIEKMFIIQEKMLWGLILAVVGEPKNAREKMKRPYVLTYNCTDIDINSLWGNISKIKNLIGYYAPGEEK